MKKIAALVGAGALVLALVVPAMARRGGGGGGGTSPSTGGVDITNQASVTTTVSATADSGRNSIGGICVRGGNINTGRASSGSIAEVYVNTNKVKDGCTVCGSNVKVSNGATVNTTVSTTANTGYNSISGMGVGGGSVSTGNANAESEAYVVVNSNLVRE